MGALTACFPGSYLGAELDPPNPNFSTAQRGHNSANLNFCEITAVKHCAPFLVLKQTLVTPVIIVGLIFITQAASLMLGKH